MPGSSHPGRQVQGEHFTRLVCEDDACEATEVPGAFTPVPHEPLVAQLGNADPPLWKTIPSDPLGTNHRQLRIRLTAVGHVPCHCIKKRRRFQATPFDVIQKVESKNYWFSCSSITSLLALVPIAPQRPYGLLEPTRAPQKYTD